MDISIFSKVAQLHHHHIISPMTRPGGVYNYNIIKIINKVSAQFYYVAMRIKTHLIFSMLKVNKS